MKRITEEQIRTLVSTFKVTDNVSQSSRAAGVAVVTGRRLLREKGLQTARKGGSPKRTLFPPDLGQMSDGDIARREGVTKQTVRYWRQVQDPPIPPYKP